MIILVYSASNQHSIEENFGAAEYSYYFVLREFLPILQKLGKVITINNPETEVDTAFDKAKKDNEDCIFLTFSPPHKSFISNKCPTIPILAWEFNDIPSEQWDNEPKNDWRLVLGLAGMAITHSEHSVSTIRKSMGTNFPVIAVPSPVWNRFHQLNKHPKSNGYNPSFDLNLKGYVLDTKALDDANNLQESIAEYFSESISLNFHGVIYTSVLNPLDGRKNWRDMVTAFCWALSAHDDATLILKFTCNHTREWPSMFKNILSSLPAFKCRVVIINGYLDDNAYSKLATLSSYTVNSSRGEGQCLPLMEYMSCGIPAVSPNHTGMMDYVTPNNSFVVKSTVERSVWPDDTRRVYRTTRYRIDWTSLRECYEKSYNTAKHEQAAYLSLSKAAKKDLEHHCSQNTATRKLKRLFIFNKQRTEKIAAL